MIFEKTESILIIEPNAKSSSVTVRHEPLIRCKECKFWNKREQLCNDLIGFGRSWHENDYCSYGERREDE